MDGNKEEEKKKNRSMNGMKLTKTRQWKLHFQMISVPTDENLITASPLTLKTQANKISEFISIASSHQRHLLYYIHGN